MKEANSTLKKVHCVQQRKERMCDTNPRTISNSYTNRVIHKCAGNQCSGVPVFWSASKLCIFLITVRTFFMHSTQYMQNKLEKSKQKNSLLHIFFFHSTYLPAGLISSPPKPLQSKNRAFRITYHKQAECIA